MGYGQTALVKMGATAELLEASRSLGYTFEVLPKPIHRIDLLREIQSAIGFAVQ